MSKFRLCDCGCFTDSNPCYYCRKPERTRPMNRSTQIMQTAMARNTSPIVTEIAPDYPTGYIVLADAVPDATFLSAGEAKGHRDELREMGHIVQIVAVVMNCIGALDAMHDALDDAARGHGFAPRVGPARLAKIAASVGVRLG